MEPMGHVSQPAPEARALTRQEEAARYAPYQALLEKSPPHQHQTDGGRAFE